MKGLLKTASVIIASLLVSGCAGPGSKVIHPGGEAEAMLRVADKARKTGNPDASISFYNKVLQLSPNNPKAYLGLAENYIDTNLLDAAIGYIDKAESSGCNKNHSYYLRGKIALINGKVAEAERMFKQSTSIDATNAIGTIYDERGDHNKAQDMYKKVIAIDPNYIDAYNNLGISLLLTGKYKDAVFYLENACSLPEANVTYRSNLALAYGLCGDIRKARMVYAQDFEGDTLEEKVGYLEDLLAAKQAKRYRQQLDDSEEDLKLSGNKAGSKKAKGTPHFFRNRNKSKNKKR